MSEAVEYLKPGEAAKELRIARATLLDWIARHDIGVVRLTPRTYLVPRSEVRRLLDERFVPAVPR